MTTTYNTKSASQMEQELADRINELNQFVYHVSHDLMAPLCSIKGLLDLIARERPIGHHDLLNRIKVCIDRLSDFTQNTLAYSENLNIPVQSTEFSLDELVNEVFHKFQTYHLDVNMKLEFTPTGKTIYSDPKRWLNVLDILFSNAFQFKDTRKERALIRIRIHQEFDNLVLEFSDNGLGIPKSCHDQIKNIFFRGAHSKGNGLGLYVLQQITESLNGLLTIESEENKYTKVVLETPVKDRFMPGIPAKSGIYTDAQGGLF